MQSLTAILVGIGTALFWAGLQTGRDQAEAALPIVEGASAKELGEHCVQLVRFFNAHEDAFAKDAAAKLRTLLDSEPAADFSEKIQKLLDAHCLVGVTINPESRVKAIRGGAEAALTIGRPRLLLIKVSNEAGVTHALAVTGPQLRNAGQKETGGWLEASLQTSPPLRKTLSGQKVEYVVLQLTAREPDRREAVLTFDVGQGTQDLGFRAEVPILFSVQAEQSTNGKR